MIAQDIISGITLLGALTAAFVAYRTNATTASKTVIDLQDKRINLMVEQTKEQDKRILTLTEMVAKLQGEKIQMQERIGTLEIVSLDRNPLFAEMAGKITKIHDVVCKV